MLSAFLARAGIQTRRCRPSKNALTFTRHSSHGSGRVYSAANSGCLLQLLRLARSVSIWIRSRFRNLIRMARGDQKAHSVNPNKR